MGGNGIVARAPCAGERNIFFFDGVKRPFVATLYKDVGRERKGSSKGYVTGAIELSVRRRMKQEALVDISKPKSQ